MASDTAVGSNVEIVREYTRRVFNAHDPDLAAEYVTPTSSGTAGRSARLRAPRTSSGCCGVSSARCRT